MHALAILVFLAALITAGHIIRSTIVQYGDKILAALAGEAPDVAAWSSLADASVVPFPGAAERSRVSPPVELPLAA